MKQLSLHRLALALIALVAGAVPSIASASGAATPNTYYLFVLNDPAPGLEDEFNKWYDLQHAQDVLVNPDYIDSQRYFASEIQLGAGSGPPNKYAIRFKIDSDDIARTLAYIHENIRSGKTVPTKTIARGEGRGGDFVYKAIAEAVRGSAPAAPQGRQPASKYLQVTFATAAAGKEAEFNAWYDQVFAPRVTKLPGVRQWQRFELSPVQLTKKMNIAEPYMAMYDIEASDPATLTRLRDEVRKLEQTLGDAGTIGASYTYQTRGPLLLGADVKKERAARQAP